MNKLQHMSHNATLNSVELIDTISENIFGFGKNGHRAKRWSFSDFMNGGEMHVDGYKMTQGKQEPRIGEWSKMMIRGRGFFITKDPRTQETMYTRLGDFHVDGQGSLVSAEGFHVQGIPLAGAPTHLRGPNPENPDYSINTIHFQDPFNNPITHNKQELNAPGQAVGNVQDINIKIDPRNGKYLGLYDKIEIGEDGVIYGKDGNTLVSLYKVSLANFNNPEGLENAKDGIYFKRGRESGFPSLDAVGSKVIGQALEKSNTWIKEESHYLTDAQRYYQASTSLHKLADKITGTAIEMIS